MTSSDQSETSARDGSRAPGHDVIGVKGPKGQSPLGRVRDGSNVIQDGAGGEVTWFGDGKKPLTKREQCGGRKNFLKKVF